MPYHMRALLKTTAAMNDIKQIRKLLVWGIPLYIGLIIGSALMVAYILVPTVAAIAVRAPAVRIAPGAQLAPFIALFCLLGIVVGVMRAIPCSDRLIKKFEFAANAAVVASGIALLLVPVTSVVQRFYMPSLGYSVCSELQGNPTMWFTDWVRDSAWCVKGKSLDWVNDQAGSAIGHVTP